jgi:hypothetical protein
MRFHRSFHVSVLALALVALTTTGCGEATQYLRQAVDFAGKLGETAAKVEETSSAISETASTWSEASEGPVEDREVTELDFSSITFLHRECKASGGYLECGYALRLADNIPQKRINFQVQRAFTPEGLELRPRSFSLGNQSSSREFEHLLVGGVPTQGRMSFEGAPTDTRTLKVIEISVDGRTLYLRNIPVAVK